MAKVIEIKSIASESDRKYGGEGHIDILAKSMKDVGLLNPIIVRENADKTYHIIAGRRRLAAAIKLKWKEIPAEVWDRGSPEDMKKVALAENVNRADMHPLDEAAAFSGLLQRGTPIEEIAKNYDRSVSGIYQRARLLGLIEGIKIMFRDGKITLTQAAMLAALPEEQQQMFFKKYGGKDEIYSGAVSEFLHSVQHNKLVCIGGVKCETCKKRTNYTDKSLFPELTAETDVCFDGECYAEHWIALLERELAAGREAHPGTKDIIVFDGIPRFWPKNAGAVTIGGVEYQIKKYTYANCCYKKEKGSFYAWNVEYSPYYTGGNLRISRGLYKEITPKKEEAKEKPLSKYNLDKVIERTAEEYREIDAAIQKKREKSYFDIENEVRRAVLKKIISAQSVKGPDPRAEERFWQGYFERNDNNNDNNKGIYEIYTGEIFTKDCAGVLRRYPREKVFEMLTAMDLGLYELPDFEDLAEVKERPCAPMEFAGMGAEAFTALYREAAEEALAALAAKPEGKSKRGIPSPEKLKAKRAKEGNDEE
jgi:ParB/RepB/Spo0J family partition protein